MKFRFVALLASCSALSIAGPSLAQDAPIAQDAPGAPDVPVNPVPADAVAQSDTEVPQDEAIAGEIVVTAQKRAERIIDVPISVSVVNTEQLDRQNIATVGELSRAVPSLTGNNPQQLGVRGVQTTGVTRSSESATAVVLDGVVLGRAATSGLFDIARVEVLAGPQGMLFGKNASAGVVNIVTNAPNPDKFEVIGHVDLGSYELHRERLTINVPVADNAALRVGLYNAKNDTPLVEVLSGKRNYTWNNGIRGRFLWEPTDELTINLIGDFERSGDAGFLNSAPAIVGPTTPLATTLATRCGIAASLRNNRTCVDARGKTRQARRYGVSANVDYELPSGYTITSITANRWFKQGPLNFGRLGGDSDLLPLDILSTNLTPVEYKSLSQELRLASPTGQLVEFVVGAFYSDTDSTDRVLQAGTLGLSALFPLLGLPPGSRFGRITTVNVDQRSAAVFGQAKINVTDQLSFIAGGRFTDERLRVGVVTPGAAELAALGFAFLPNFSNAFPNIIQVTKNDNFSWRLGVQYEFSRDLMTYFTASRGYKGPAVNDQAVVAAGISPIIDPEFPMYYEAGLKGSFLNGRVLGTVAVFHNKVKGFQTPVFVPASAVNPVPGFVQGNAPYIKAKGFEVALSGRPTDELTLNLGVIYNDSSYSPDFLVACNQRQTRGVGTCSALGTTNPVEHLANSPLWRVVASGEYAREVRPDLTAFFQADVVHESSIDFTPTPDEFTRRKPTFLLGARVGGRDPDGRWGASLFVRNLLDKHYPSILGDPLGGFNGGAGQSYLTSPSIDNERTYGATVDFRF